jgi:hypothetical protein
VADLPFPLPGGVLLSRTCSIGFSCWPFGTASPHAVAWERVVDLADAALYAAKRGGRNAWTGLILGPSAADPADAVESFRVAPETAIASGAIMVQSSGVAMDDVVGRR